MTHSTLGTRCTTTSLNIVIRRQNHINFRTSNKDLDRPKGGMNKTNKRIYRMSLVTVSHAPTGIRTWAVVRDSEQPLVTPKTNMIAHIDCSTISGECILLKIFIDFLKNKSPTWWDGIAITIAAQGKAFLK